MLLIWCPSYIRYCNILHIITFSWYCLFLGFIFVVKGYLIMNICKNYLIHNKLNNLWIIISLKFAYYFESSEVFLEKLLLYNCLYYDFILFWDFICSYDHILYFCCSSILLQIIDVQYMTLKIQKIIGKKTKNVRSVKA